MDLLEQFLAGDEEHLCSYSAEELEVNVQLLSDLVRSHRLQLNKTEAEVQNLEDETTERSLTRALLASWLAQVVDLQEALEEEEKTQQQLKATTDEMERLSEAGSAESCEVLEMRLKGTEDLLSASCQQEKALLEEVEVLKTSLEKLQAALGKMMAEHEAVETELLAVQNRDPAAAQSPQTQGEVTQVLRACMEEMGLLNVLATKHPKK
ncbi:golgin subfamily A member 1-like [Eleutherodactylus coqui]|uniref:Uncharacterized protein n=1 Tax=Eleutherodactylus coqui TaxID=57060 RepID=A0A8J6EWZ7_ELECQ|nr:hypothetical protein GDO78_002781 [Eleutherodactylus coqui]